VTSSISVEVHEVLHCHHTRTKPLPEVTYRKFCEIWMMVFSERELTFTLAICCRTSVCRLSSVTLVHPT